MEKQTHTRRRRSKADLDAAVAAGNEASRALGATRAGSQTQATAPVTENAVNKTRRGVRKQEQAATPAKAANKPGRKPKATQAAPAGEAAQAKAGDGGGALKATGSTGETRAAGSGRGKAKQGQSAAPAPASGFRAGAGNVLITEAAMGGKIGRPRGEDHYPFDHLAPAHKDGDGRIVGQSFFIPDVAVATNKLAAARKRYKKLFWSRTVEEQVDGKGESVQGLRIWHGTPELSDLAKR